MSGKYDDIINMDYSKSGQHSQMPINKRAAQFAPFAALKGFDEVIDEQDEKLFEISDRQS